MILEQNGIVDYRDKGRYYNPGTGQWQDVTSWDTWSCWTLEPLATLYLTLDPLDLGTVETVNLLSSIRCRGVVNYYVYYGNEKDFTDSPLNYSTLYITNAQQNIPSITARYIWIKLAIDYNVGLGFQYFDSISIKASEDSTKGKTLSFTGIDSSTLPGTTSDRVYTPPVNVGTIKSAKVFSQGSPEYDVDMYVYHSPKSIYTFPHVISTGSNVHLTFVGVDGRNRDSEFDIDLTVNPEWYMDPTGNLLER